MRWPLVLLGFIIAFIFSVRVHSQDIPPSLDAARKEGTVSWYTTLGVSESQPLAIAFEKKYPFLKVNLYRSQAEKLLSRIGTEIRTGQYLFDILAANDIEFFVLLKQGLFATYISPESKAYPAAFKDPKGLWTDTYNNYHSICFNTKLVNQKEAPADWKDLLDPKWRSGKIALVRNAVPWYGNMMKIMGEKSGRALFEGLAAQQIQFHSGYTNVAQLLAAGEFPLALCRPHRIEKMRETGAPVDWVRTANPIIADLHPIGLAGRAAHPNAAKLFIDFVLSRPGQELAVQQGRISPRPDLKPPYPRLSTRGLHIVPSVPAVADTYNQYSEEYRKLFALR
ncbi:MAG: extracellular solute-binding protein [Deltaproteobacteria bacterium]|nr:extracellular solute-binding protein [Deltaproteobacteria bacterium]